MHPASVHDKPNPQSLVTSHFYLTYFRIVASTTSV